MKTSTLYIIKLLIINLLLVISTGGIYAQPAKDARLTRKAGKKLVTVPQSIYKWSHVGVIKLDSLRVNSTGKQANLYYNNILSYIPVRENLVATLNNELKDALGRSFRDYTITIYSDGKPLVEYIPNALRETIPFNSSRIKQQQAVTPLIQNANKPIPGKGLANTHIALWHSHGWYYEAALDRWEWQRARLFGSVEDIGTMAYVLPYLVPMLENAGAVTLLPRERSTQVHEIIIDNDGSTGNSELLVYNSEQHLWKQQPSGFHYKDTLFEKENPFVNGSHLAIENSGTGGARLQYIPDMPKSGSYPVYVSWVTLPLSLSNVNYTIHHAGGSTNFVVNQQMGGGTWHYLGTFDFIKGKDARTGSVEINNRNNNTGTITSDAVRFGGGTGNVARRATGEYIARQWSLSGESNAALKGDAPAAAVQTSWKTSGRKRYLEAARYYLQWAGIPSSVYSLTDYKNDYNDDYQSRGEWVNYLMGLHQPDSLTVTGLNIPVDMAFAFHTDAGVTPNDSVIGTLAIYNTTHQGTEFKNGQDRMASRDLSDLIQTAIVDDIRRQFNPQWTRRAMWDKAYSEAWRPQAPTMLLELLSHQNLADMKYALDPRYRFAVSRSIYKGMLRYQAAQQQREYVVQPLAPDGFAITLLGGKRIRLNWQPVTDTLEPSAASSSYKVYKRKGKWGFDNGMVVNSTSAEIELESFEDIYSFYITACNDGGESMPSETLAVCLQNATAKPVLIVNGFTRISGPKFIDNGNDAGVAWWDDQGVPHIANIAHVGKQYDFNRKSEWLDDDSPGWGASFADMEGKPVPGNTFDFSYIHGEAIAAAGYSFVSVSRKYFEENEINTNDYFALDVIMGEQRSVPQYLNPDKKDFAVFTGGLINNMKKFAGAGKGILLTGAYVGTDMAENNDSTAIAFARDYLHYKWRTNHADNKGKVLVTDVAAHYLPGSVEYNAGYHPEVYTVEAPDAIEPAGKNAATIFRYAGNNTSAGVLYNGEYKTVTLGFPFESIPDTAQRNQLMKSIIQIFNNN